jgi:hypothetical protein
MIDHSAVDGLVIGSNPLRTQISIGREKEKMIDKNLENREMKNRQTGKK